MVNTTEYREVIESNYFPSFSSLSILQGSSTQCDTGSKIPLISSSPSALIIEHPC